MLGCWISHTWELPGLSTTYQEASAWPQTAPLCLKGISWLFPLLCDQCHHSSPSNQHCQLELWQWPPHGSPGPPHFSHYLDARMMLYPYFNQRKYLIPIKIKISQALENLFFRKKMIFIFLVFFRPSVCRSFFINSVTVLVAEKG